MPGAEWVLEGEGIATRKFDGACCMVRDGRLFKRYDAKNGKTLPPGFEPAQDADPVTGHLPGWLAVGDGPEDKWFREACHNSCGGEGALEDGTYEAIGPHFQGNAENRAKDQLVKHGSVVVDAPRTFSDLRDWLKLQDIEGVVWHHPDGRMVKVKARDFHKLARHSQK